MQVVGSNTNSTLELVTNGERLYTAPNLPASTYRLVFAKQGFASVTREPIEVRPRGSVRVDTMLQPGAVSESINVSAEAPVLDTAAINNSAGFQ